MQFFFVFLTKLEYRIWWYFIKDLLYNHSTIWDWSEDGKWKKNMNLISFKKQNICTKSLIYKQKTVI